MAVFCANRGKLQDADLAACHCGATGMSNVEFELAQQFALHTRRHCFITGKAGTGKTYLLKQLAQGTAKKFAVVAPTGIAAINAGGTTIHSMFGLPLGCLIPNDDAINPNLAINRHRLVKDHLRLPNHKRQVLCELELLIIDEVSMVRCDILDAVDFVLRHVRNSEQPFGGVQVLLIGDVHQLPPVAKESDWSVLERYYRSRYFFDSCVWPQVQAVQIELQTIYRQNDERLLALLNNIRHRKLPSDDRHLLRELYNPTFQTEPGYVLLTTHNHTADNVNSSELATLPGAVSSFDADIGGEYPESLFPCERALHLKPGAQVMFIRNDTESDNYYNGKLATVKQIDGADIKVTFKDSGADYTLHRETWEHIEYRVADDSGEVVKHVLGTFSQYPLRLAWAITIHKSQGLTFDKVIVDAARSFESGQVYVALSRCRSLQGIVLRSLFALDALPGDSRLDEFSASHHAMSELQQALPAAKREYAIFLLLQSFFFQRLAATLDEWPEAIAATKLPDKKNTIELCERLQAQVGEICATARKFHRELGRLIEQGGSTASTMQARCGKAIEYFTAQIATQLVKPLREHIDTLTYKTTIKPYLDRLRLMENNLWREIEQLYAARFLEEPLYTGMVRHSRPKPLPSRASANSDTFQATLDLHRQGKSAAEIAAVRQLRITTIKSHLTRWIETGDLDIYEVLPATVVDPVLAFLQRNRGANLSDIRNGTGDQFDWDDIRMIVAHSSRV